MPKVRPIIEIDEEKCTGCGLCVPACAEGALQVIEGKARLVGEIYCDGLGACLGECPEGALRVIERPADEFDEAAVEKRQAAQKAAPAEVHGIETAPAPGGAMACGCPSSMARSLKPNAPTAGAKSGKLASSLGHWPIKLQLLAPQAPFLKGADLLLLADCAAAAYPALHPELLPGKAVALACPKLDDAQAHINKLAAVLAAAKPRSLTVVHMEVPCCKGLAFIAEKALEKAGVAPKLGRMMIGMKGGVLETENLPWESVA